MSEIKCSKCGFVVRKKTRKKKNIDYKKIFEFPSLGKCNNSPTGNHRLKLTSLPGPEVRKNEIDQFECELLCIDCPVDGGLRKFHVPYRKIRSKAKA